MNDYNIKKEPIVIVGAGPAGLTAAYELAQLKFKVVVLECSASSGGISKTINYKGNLIDIGGHRFFSKSEKVLKWWAQMLPFSEVPKNTKINYHNKSVDLKDIISSGKNELMILRDRKSRIYFHRRFFEYPLQVNYALIKNLGKRRSLRIVKDLIKAKIKPIKNEKSLEDFYINRFGEELYKTFFKDYTKKVWGLSCKDLSADWGRQRVKSLDIRSIIWHSIKKLIYSTGTYGSKAQRSLIEKFLYPAKGPGMMWDKVEEKCLENGVQIIKQAWVNHIGLKSNSAYKVSYVKDDATHEIKCSALISTMPLKHLIRSLSPSAPKHVRSISDNLQYRDFIIVGLSFTKLKFKQEKNEFIKDNWLYIQDKGVKIGRLQVFNNWSPHMVNGDHCWIGAEYFCSKGDSIWNLDQKEMIRLAVEELEQIGIVDKTEYLDGTVVKCPKAYPSYTGSYSQMSVIQGYVEELHNGYPVGRNGLHKYNNQDHSMLTAFKAVELIKNKSSSKKELWTINADDEYHEVLTKRSKSMYKKIKSVLVKT